MAIAIEVGFGANVFIIFYSIACGGAQETHVGLPTKPTLRESHGLAWRNSVGVSPNSENGKARQLREAIQEKNLL